jgi:hypothetical protein
MSFTNDGWSAPQRDRKKREAAYLGKAFCRPATRRCFWRRFPVVPLHLSPPGHRLSGRGLSVFGPIDDIGRFYLMTGGEEAPSFRDDPC